MYTPCILLHTYVFEYCMIYRVWQHIICVGLDKKNIPTNYLCDQCIHNGAFGGSTEPEGSPNRPGGGPTGPNEGFAGPNESLAGPNAGSDRGQPTGANEASVKSDDGGLNGPYGGQIQANEDAGPNGHWPTGSNGNPPTGFDGHIGPNNLAVGPPTGNDGGLNEHATSPFPEFIDEIYENLINDGTFESIPLIDEFDWDKVLKDIGAADFEGSLVSVL